MAQRRGIDFKAEGLLAGLAGEARSARLALLAELAAAGVSLDELREAVASGRLTLLPVERALAGEGPRYTPREVAEISGADPDLIRRATTALGLPYPDPEERALSDADLGAARRVKAFHDAGLPDEGIIAVARTIGIATARIAEANRELMLRTLMRPGDSERELALRFAAAAEQMLPLFEPTLLYALRAHLLEQVRRDVIGAADLAAGETGATIKVGVCFADLVGFTKLGEEIAAEELGLIAARLEGLAVAAAEPPVRLVKLIGDAAMLVCTEAGPLLMAALGMVAAAEREGEGFPRLRAGLAYGPALARSGDYYGRPVNLASRLAAIAKPGGVLVDLATKEQAGEDFDFSFAGRRRLKGFEGAVKLFRARRGAQGGLRAETSRL